MPNWMDPKEIALDAAIFTKILIALLGLYVWEVCCTFSYDWSVFTRKRPFKYPMGFYFACRYTLLLALLGINIATNITTQVNCQSLYVFNQLMGNVAIATASTLLMLRTIAIWSRNLYIVVPLVTLALGQWGILLHGVVTVHAEWYPAANACAVTGTLPVFLDLIYIYTMSYDLLVLVLSCIGLVKTSGRSDLWTLLFKDGIVYFVVAFSANCVATVLLLLNLNPAMNIIATVPAAVASTIVACRGFVRLSTWNSREVYLPSHVQSSAPPRPAVSMSTGKRGTGVGDVSFVKPPRLAAPAGLGKPQDGVHISMEAYTTRERGSPYDKDYDDDIEEEGSDFDSNPGVRYTSTPEHRVRLPQAPAAPTGGAQSPASTAVDEKGRY